MTNSKASDRNAEERHRGADSDRAADRLRFVKQWTEYVRTHDDEEWARQQHEIVNSQLRSAKELAANGDTDPAEFFRKKDELARRQSD